MSFSFGFSGDDIEEDPNDVVDQSEQVHEQSNNVNTIPPPLAATTHSLRDMLSSLPSKISYSLLSLTSPLGHSITLPRRDLFDVRLQLMAEDPLSPDNTTTTTTPLTGLESSDLTPNIYEGGYKTWECSLDLCRYLLDRGPRKSLDDMVRVNHVVEMGCGSALPSLLLFQYALQEELGMEFSLADYNEDVLRLVTVPNLLLMWALALGEERSAAVFAGVEGGNPLKNAEESGDLYVTPEMIAEFTEDLGKRGVGITLVSGSWAPVERFVELLPTAEGLNTLILGSETIYSPSSCTAFTDAITGLMKRVKMGKAIVAAKRVYFGVGGSVDGFRMECSERGAVAYEVEFEGLDGDAEGGVRRCLMEVQMY
ncbi:hypothetical protein DE146DRAFT_618748 [Phaeosphaeria sp. MPI-PUGE-AT-0046c]|nr:hypothetical protein DE146DRAFT_618748 [Phaeosphaeria sp. MPI-PUGE-AT-0046c]